MTEMVDSETGEILHESYYVYAKSKQCARFWI